MIRDLDQFFAQRNLKAICLSFLPLDLAVAALVVLFLQLLSELLGIYKGTRIASINDKTTKSSDLFYSKKLIFEFE